MVSRSNPIDAQKAGPKLYLIGLPLMRFWWLALVALGAQTLLLYLSEESSVIPGWAIRTGITLSYLPLLAVVALNFRWLGLRLLGIGIALNFIVIVANGGLMPLNLDAVPDDRVSSAPETYQPGNWVRGTKSIVLDREQTRLRWLSDTFKLPADTLGRPMIFSLGDIFIALGLVIMALILLRYALLSLLPELLLRAFG